MNTIYNKETRNVRVDGALSKYGATRKIKACIATRARGGDIGFDFARRTTSFLINIRKFGITNERWLAITLRDSIT